MLQVNGGRIPSLDGWRALAIISVMLTHLWATNKFHDDGPITHYVTMQGDLGVRVFFVLSGFLITHLLLTEYEKFGRISLKAFYTRRILRIFPVYYAYLFVLLALSAAGLYREGLTAWIGAFTFTRDLIGQSSATGHFWSLAVEEQFYLIWPAAIVGLSLTRRRRLFSALLTGVMVICFVARLLPCAPELVCKTILRNHSPLMYMDSIAVGCLMAPAIDSKTFWRWRPSLGLPASILLLASTLFVDVESKLLSSILLTTQALLIAICVAVSATAKSGIVFRTLNHPAIVQIGLLSYSLYVWHMIFLAHFIGPPLAALPIYDWRLWWIPSLIVAIISFHLFETPILKLKKRFERMPRHMSPELAARPRVQEEIGSISPDRRIATRARGWP
ncbi:acyltransferase family protein [Bradyrhizobium sp.]|uniref:acyltransferase family protein n=1 Tax=Bradyrhizobium sp. TaxID=376 RepID=UPI0039E227D5